MVKAFAKKRSWGKEKNSHSVVVQKRVTKALFIHVLKQDNLHFISWSIFVSIKSLKEKDHIISITPSQPLLFTTEAYFLLVFSRADYNRGMLFPRALRERNLSRESAFSNVHRGAQVLPEAQNTKQKRKGKNVAPRTRGTAIPFLSERSMHTTQLRETHFTNRFPQIVLSLT